MRVKLLEYDKTTLNGRFYKKEIVEKAINNLVESSAPILGQVKSSTEGDMNNPVIRLVDCGFEIKEFFFNDEEHQLEGEIKLLKTPKGEIAKELLESENYQFYMIGYGDFLHGNVVDNLKIVGFNLSVNPFSIK